MLYAARASSLKPGGLFQPISREGALVVNNVILGAAAAAVFIGTLYPLALEALTGDKISVGPPYFNLTFVPLILPLLLIVPLGPLMPWKRSDLKGVMQRLGAAAAIALLIGIATFAIHHRGPWLAPFGMALGAWLVAGSLTELVERCGLGRIEVAAALRRLAGLPGASFGTVLAHAGIGVLIIGIVGVTAWREERIAVMKPGDQVNLAGLEIVFQGATPFTGANYTAERGRFVVMERGREITTLAPEKRQFQPGRQVTSEVGLHQFPSGDLYVVMGEGRSDGGRSVRIYFNPLASLIWLGALIMFIGGAVSLTDRRYRIGVPKLKSRHAVMGREA
jgi:cytochrome c-type biogenesis protein CcmF